MARQRFVNGRQAYVVDVTREPEYSSCARIWIDREAGVPIQVRRFDRHPTVPEAKATTEVNDITLHRLPNGGWIPVAGIHRFNNSEYSSRERIRVDVNSIRADDKEVPESLFWIEFPPGATIYDGRSHLTSIVGQTPKTYEQIVAGDRDFIAGTVVDENGVPVPRVGVAAMMIATQREDGKAISKFLRGQPCTTTDAKGRFALELQEQGAYDLQFYPQDFPYVALSGVPLGEHDLKITLGRGGVVTGRVVRLIDGQKVPMPAMEVQAAVYNLHVLHRDRMQITDAEGRFQFRGLETDQRGPRFGKPPETPCNPIPWRINCGRTRTTVQFEEGVREQTVELVLRPDPRMAPSLVGRPLPQLDGLGFDVPADYGTGKRLLICFFDMNQRPDPPLSQ